MHDWIAGVIFLPLLDSQPGIGKSASSSGRAHSAPDTSLLTRIARCTMILHRSMPSLLCCASKPDGKRSASQGPLTACPPPCRRSCGTGSCSGCCKGPGGALGNNLKRSNRRSIAPPPEALGIYYSTATGKTQEVADAIKDVLGDAATEPTDIGDVADLQAALSDPSLDGLIVGAPTWNTGADEGRSGTAWDDVLQQVTSMNLKGRKVAVFGCGDQYGYGDYFCDAMEELYSSFAAAGCDMVGHWPTQGYEHSESKAEIKPGVFCGLALDEDNQGELSAQRIKQWTAQVLQEVSVKTTA